MWDCWIIPVTLKPQSGTQDMKQVYLPKYGIYLYETHPVSEIHTIPSMKINAADAVDQNCF